MSRKKIRFATAGRAAWLCCLLGALHARADWPTFRGDAGLSGHGAAVLGDALDVKWMYRAPAGVLFTPVVSGDTIVVATETSQLVALSRAGARRWTAEIDAAPDAAAGASIETIGAPPVMVGAHVIAGSRAGSLCAFTREHGRLAWRIQVEGGIQGSPTFLVDERAQPRVFAVGQRDGIVHAVRGGSGERLWRSPPTARCDGSLSAAEGRIVFGNCDAMIVALSAGDGSVLHSLALGPESQIAGGVAVQGSRVFSGARSGLLAAGDVAEGRIVWRLEAGRGPIYSTPAAAPRRVVATTDDGAVLCVDRESGRLDWSVDTGGLRVEPAVVAGDRVLVSVDGALWMLDLADGRRLWERKISDTITAPAVAADGTVLVASEDGTVRAFEPAGGMASTRRGERQTP